MLPNADNAPPGFGQLPICIGVSAAIRVDLLAPPFRVRLWPRAVFGAAVPEATVYEDRDTKAREGNVRRSAQLKQRVVNAESKTVPVEY
jgi:hypothetical protein